MKKILGFEDFVNESFLNEEELPGSGGIVIQYGKEGIALEDKVPYITIGSEGEVSLHKRVGGKTSRLEFRGDNYAEGHKGVWSQFGDIEKMRGGDVEGGSKQVQIFKTPAECAKNAYRLLIDAYAIYTGVASIADIQQKSLEDLVKSFLVVSKNPNTKTAIAGNTCYKSFINGLLNTFDVKASLGEYANVEGVNTAMMKTAVQNAAKA